MLPTNQTSGRFTATTHDMCSVVYCDQDKAVCLTLNSLSLYVFFFLNDYIKLLMGHLQTLNCTLGHIQSQEYEMPELRL